MNIRILERKLSAEIKYTKRNPNEPKFMTLDELNNDFIILQWSKTSLMVSEDLANGLFNTSKIGEKGDRIVFLEEILEIIFGIDVDLDKPYYYEEGERIEWDYELVGLKTGQVFVEKAYVIRFHPTHY